MLEKYNKIKSSTKGFATIFYAKSKQNNKLNKYFYGLLFALSFFVSETGFSQNATQMSFSTTTGSSLNDMTGSTLIMGANQDDTASGLYSFGFTFTYCGIDYTEFSVSSNGVMRLGGTTVTNSGFNSITNSAPLLAPCWEDMHTGTNGKVHAIVSGTAPNRVLTVEWLYRKWSGDGSNYTKTVQLTLQETTNIINFKYGANTGASLSGATIGINNTTALFQCVNTSTNVAGTVARNNETVFPESGRRYTWTPPVPTITSLGSASGCPGSSITINGTNFYGITAANVKIGGTPVSSITSFTATQIIAVIGSGTTGTVTVTTYGGTATSVATFTVNPPTITSQPTTPPATCAGAGTQGLTVAATGGGSTTYQWRRNGVNLTNVAPYSDVTTANLTITNPSISENGVSIDVVLTNGVCSTTSVSNVLTVLTLPTATTGPVPANAATGVCYSGPGEVTSLSWTAVSGAASYNVYFGTTATPPFIANQAGTTYSTGTLLPNTTYYWKIIAKNSCGDSTTSSTWSFTTANAPCTSCIASSTSSFDYINNFSTTGGLGNITNNGTGYLNGGYTDYSGTKIVTQYPGSSVNFSSVFGGASQRFAIWVDWNDDGNFTTAAYPTGERMFLNGSTAASASGSITVPAAAAMGNHRMRIRSYWAGVPSPCGTQNYGEAEDYTFTVIPQFCSANPSVIAVNVTTNTTATVTWSAASPAPISGYQYYLSTSNITPAYGAAPTGSTAAGITTANLIGLTPGATYYIWVRSNCGAIDGQGAWTGPVSFFVPLCTVGNSTGTTTLACPSVVSGGLGLNGAAPATLTCTTGSCVDLEATFLPIGQTTNYTVQSIPYSPPYQFSCLKNPVSVNTDDIWSPVVNLPFTFCFYGNTYTSCIIGSNGIVSFGNNGRAGTATGYAYNNNLPSTAGALFANSIYGAYHDIDPSKGGEVGWELITLNTGCRAMVASWSNVPMYYDNSILYTGMMVFYENTNVIEVYLKEKKIDGGFLNTWNNGNAIIGIQNSTATQAVVAPNRNGLSADWTATNEAWRFVPSGASVTSIKWYQGAGVSGTVVGNTAVVNLCPAATTTYTAEVTYSLCNGLTRTETSQTVVTVTGNKNWNGSVNTDWNNDNNWSPIGKPTALDCVVIPSVTNAPIISGTSYNGLGYSLVVQNGGILTVNSNNSITITNTVTVNAGGTFNLENSSSLIQINNVANSGNIRYKRNATINSVQDYVYWGSPVAGQVIDNITTPNPLRNIYTWSPLTANSNGASSQGIYVGATGSTMALAKGYIGLPPSGATTTINAIFTGVPNNGIIPYTVSRGTYTGASYLGNNGTQITNLSDNYNLIANPYPSSISANQFLVNNSAVIQDGLQIWTHGTLPSSAIPSPFYASYASNYTPNDFLKVNLTGNNSGSILLDNYKVGSGQAFFVTMLDGVTGNAVVNFNNTLRSNTYNNSTFYRNGEGAETDYDNLERHRIWLDIVGSSQTQRSLVGYIEGATDEEDTLYDFHTYVTNGVLSMYSVINESILDIQGRSLPFNEYDKIPLGYNAPTPGSYTIGIALVDGLFLGSQTIFLEDKLLNVIHDLKTAPYVFNSEAGTIDNRFVLRYNESALGTDQFDLTNSVKIVTNEKAVVYSTNQNIQSIVVFDLLGRKIDSYNTINSKQFTLKNLFKNNAVMIMKITLEDGAIVTEKFIF